PVAGIGVAEHLGIALGDQMGQAEIEHRGAALLHLGRIGRLELERGRAVQHVMGVDFSAARHIGLGRGPDNESAHARTIANSTDQLRLPPRIISPASGPSYLNSESASCTPVLRSVRVTSTLLPRLSMIAQPRS